MIVFIFDTLFFWNSIPECRIFTDVTKDHHRKILKFSKNYIDDKYIVNIFVFFMKKIPTKCDISEFNSVWVSPVKFIDYSAENFSKYLLVLVGRPSRNESYIHALLQHIWLPCIDPYNPCVCARAHNSSYLSTKVVNPNALIFVKWSTPLLLSFHYITSSGMEKKELFNLEKRRFNRRIITSRFLFFSILLNFT